MSQSVSQLKFVLDENVKKRLYTFLKSEGFDVIRAPLGVSNGKLAEFSKSEKRILVTNDFDFTYFPKEKIFSVVLLIIPQNKPESFIKSFSNLLKHKSKSEDYEGFSIRLLENNFEVVSIKDLFKTK